MTTPTHDQVAQVRIRKDEWIASRPWHADLVFEDGRKFKGWTEFARTKKQIVEGARWIAPNATIIDHNGKIL